MSGIAQSARPARKPILSDHSTAFGHDVFFGGVSGVRLGPHSIAANPRFRNPRTGNFHLLPSSPAIGRGVPLGFLRDLVGTRVPRAAPDAGCFEYRRAG